MSQLCARHLSAKCGALAFVRHPEAPSPDFIPQPHQHRAAHTPHLYHGYLAVSTYLHLDRRYIDILCRWYRAITPKTRIMIGVGVMAYAGAGLLLSDKAEEKLGLTPTDKDLAELREALPKISIVDRKER